MSATHRIVRASAVALVLLLACPLAAPATWPSDPATDLPVVVTAGSQYPARAVRDAAGGTYVVWLDDRAYATLGYDVYATHILRGGAVDPLWPATGLAVAATSLTESWAPPLADGSGGVFVAWSAGTPGVDPMDDDVRLQHVRADATVDPAWPAGGRVVCAAANGQYEPELASDGAGGVLVVWSDARSGTEDVYAHHVLADGTLDPAWPASGRQVTLASNLQSYPRPLADGAGGVLVVWRDYRSGSHWDLYAHHVRADGSLDPAWPANGVAVCTAAGYQGFAEVVTDGAGGLIAVWQDDRGATRDLYAQRVLVSGVVDPAWPTNGRAVCTATGAQDYPHLVADGAGGAIVGWMDLRAGGTHDVYATRVLANGTLDPAWPANGLAVCTAANDQWSPWLVSDLAGGAILAWQDRRTGGVEDIYAQRVLATGVVDPGWPANGRALSTASGMQSFPTPTSDGTGGAVVVWCDWRNGVDADLYAMRVQKDGTLGGEVAGVDPRVASALALAPPRPHPARGGPLALGFTLPRAGDATLELFDVAGRRLDARAWSALPAGPHAARLGDASLRPGLHLVRLRHGGETRVMRVVVLE
jgi:hypothetical protein